MNTEEILTRAQEAMSVERVFGAPIQLGGVTVVPAAVVSGGGGGGGKPNQDSGAGFGLKARPAGVFVIRNERVSWHPAINVNQIVAGGQLVAIAALLTLGPALARWLRDRR